MDKGKSVARAVAVVCVLAAFAVTSWGYGGESRVAQAAGGALACLGVALMPFDSTASAVRRPPWLWPLLALAALAWLSLAVSSNPLASLTDALYAATLLLLYGACLRLGPRPTAFLLLGIVIVVAGLAVYGILQLRGLAPRDFWHNGNFASRFVNSAHFASLLAAAALALPAAAAIGPRAVAWALWLAVGPLLVWALLRTHGRAAILLAAAGSLVLGSLWLLAAARDGARRRLPAVAAAAVALAGLAALVVFSGSGLRDRFAALGATRWQSLSQRGELWTDSLAMIRANPLGVGAGAFGERHPMYKHQADRFVEEHAHNEFLQVTAELGWAAVPLLAWLTVSLAGALALAARDAARRPAAFRAAALAAALAVLLLHSLVDFPLRLPANALFAAVLLAALTGESARSEGERVQGSGIGVQGSGSRSEAAIASGFPMFGKQAAQISKAWNSPGRLVFVNGDVRVNLYDRLWLLPEHFRRWTFDVRRSTFDVRCSMFSSDSPAPSSTSAPLPQHPIASQSRALFRLARIASLPLAGAWLYLAAGQYAWEAGAARIEAGRYRDGIALVRTAARLLPLHADALFELGHGALAWAGAFDGARAAALRAESARRLAAAARWAPYRARTHDALARVFLQDGDDARAEAALQRAIACDPTLGVYHLRYADFLLAHGRRPEAAARYRAAFSAFADSAEMNAETVFRRLWTETGDAGFLRAACPDDPRCRAIQEAVVREGEARRARG